MANRSKVELIEEQYGKPAADVLVDKLNEHQSIEKAAAACDIAARTAITWMEEFGIEKDPPRWRRREAQREHA